MESGQEMGNCWWINSSTDAAYRLFEDGVGEAVRLGIFFMSRLEIKFLEVEPPS